MNKPVWNLSYYIYIFITKYVFNNILIFPNEIFDFAQRGLYQGMA